MSNQSRQPVIKSARYFLAHTPGLVRHGSEPSRLIAGDLGFLGEISAHLRPFEDAVSYPPNRAYLGSLYPDELREIERPWFQWRDHDERRQPHGDIMPEAEFYGLLKLADAFDLVWLEEGFVREVKQALGNHPLLRDADIEQIGAGQPSSQIDAEVAEGEGALPLYIDGTRLVGCVKRAHEGDATHTADVLLENLASKASASMAMRTLLHDAQIEAESVDYILNCGEEAVGDRYQRGGGNLAKAIGEMCGLSSASGSDVKAFCCAPTHALMMAATLVNSGVFKQVAVLGGCSLAKLGMNAQSHLSHDQPVLEDVLAAVAVVVGEDDGESPVLRLDSIGAHNIGAGSSLQALSKTLITDPLNRLGLGFREIDKFATELQNPEITEPTGSGDVTQRNYQLIGALAVMNKDIQLSERSEFAEKHGMPGFSSTQGHIASAVPFMGHAVDRMRDGTMERALFVAKGSLFLGRMTQMSDGLSFILERNPATRG